MSDYDENDENDENEPDAQREADDKSWRRKLEADAREGKKAANELAAAKRELAMHKAGIDLDSKAGRLFAKAYDGDSTVEAVKAAAAEYDLITPETPAVDPTEVAAHDRIANASTGGEQPGEAETALSEIAAAGSQQEVLASLAKHGIQIDNSKPGTWQRSESMGYQPLSR